MINIIDTRFGSDVWRMQAAKRFAAGSNQLDDDEIREIFHELLKEYPALA